MATTTQWEYHFLDANEDNILMDGEVLPSPNAFEFYDYANELGKQGWEMMAVVTRQGDLSGRRKPNEPGEPGYRYYFKRPLQTVVSKPTCLACGAPCGESKEGS